MLLQNGSLCKIAFIVTLFCPYCMFRCGFRRGNRILKNLEELQTSPLLFPSVLLLRFRHSSDVERTCGPGQRYVLLHLYGLKALPPPTSLHPQSRSVLLSSDVPCRRKCCFSATPAARLSPLLLIKPEGLILS